MAGYGFARSAYSCDNFLDALLVRLHFQKGLDLADGQVLPVTEGDELIECAEQFVSIPQDFPLIQALACAGDDLSEEVQGIDILEDVGLAVRDEDHVEFVKGLVDEANIVLFDGGMLCARISQLGEGCQKSFDSRSGHLAKLPREDSFPPAGADRCSKDNLGG